MPLYKNIKFIKKIQLDNLDDGGAGEGGNRKI
jgi:hypothetical protein